MPPFRFFTEEDFPDANASGVVLSTDVASHGSRVVLVEGTTHQADDSRGIAIQREAAGASLQYARCVLGLQDDARLCCPKVGCQITASQCCSPSEHAALAHEALRAPLERQT